MTFYSIAYKLLARDFLRSLQSILAISLSITAMVALNGVFQGSISQDLKYIVDYKADIFVFPRGSATYYQATTVLSSELNDEISKIAGVKAVHDNYTIRTDISNRPQTPLLFLVGFNTVTKIGGPLDISSGSYPDDEDEIAMSSTLANRLNISQGQDIKLGSSATPLRVTATVANASSFGRHLAWVSNSTAKKLFPLPGFVSFFTVDVKDTSEASSVTSEINRAYPQLIARTWEEQISSAKDFQTQSFLPVLQSMLGIAMLVLTLIIGLTSSQIVHNQRTEYGLIRSIGFSRFLTSVVVALQIGLLFVIALVLAGLAQLPLSQMLSRMNVPFELSLTSILTAAILAVTSVIIASLLTLRNVWKVDPAEVIR